MWISLPHKNRPQLGCGQASGSLDCRAFDEYEDVRIDHLGIRGHHAVREARINLERAMLKQLGLQYRGVVVRYDLVIVTLHDSPSLNKTKGGNSMATITTKDGTTIFYKDWGPKDAVIDLENCCGPQVRLRDDRLRSGTSV